MLCMKNYLSTAVICLGLSLMHSDSYAINIPKIELYYNLSQPTPAPKLSKDTEGLPLEVRIAFAEFDRKYPKKSARKQ